MKPDEHCLRDPGRAGRHRRRRRRGALTEGGARNTRILLCLVAALVVGGLFATARPEVQRLAFERSGRLCVVGRQRGHRPRIPRPSRRRSGRAPPSRPSSGQDVLRIVREYHSNLQDPALLEAVSKAAAAVYRTKVMSVATQGSDEAVAAWGAHLAAGAAGVQKRLRRCLRRLRHDRPQSLFAERRIDAALAARQGAVIAAYKSSNAATSRRRPRNWAMPTRRPAP